MADEGHLALLKQGVMAWNEWWHDHPKAVPNLEGANLQDVSLREINFYKADLRDVTLSQVDLSMANLEGANLSIAVLRAVRTAFPAESTQHAR